MKYLLAILLGVAPLAALTVWNMLSSDEPAAAAASTQNSSQFDAAAKAALAARQAAASEATVLDKLAEVVAVPYANSGNFAGSPSMQDMTRNWKAFVESRGLAEEFAGKQGLNSISPLPEKPSLPEIARRLDSFKARKIRLEELKASFSQASVGQRDQVLALLGNDLSAIEAEISALEKNQVDRSDLAVGQELFEQGKYQECFDTLVRAQALEAVELRLRAEFRKDAEPLVAQAREVEIGAPGPDLKSLRAMQAGLSQLVGGKFKQAPSPHEEQLHARCVADVEKLNGAVFMKELELGPPMDLAGWGRVGDEISRRFPQPLVRTTARDLFTAWLDQQLDAEKNSLLERSDMKEAIRGTTTLLKGYFDPQQGGTWFKHFKTAEDRGRNNYDYVTAVELTVKPREPLPVTLSKEYRRKVRALLKGERSQGDWTQFAAACQGWQETLDAYRTEFGQQVDIAFEDEADFSQRVLDNWDRIEGLMVK